MITLDITNNDLKNAVEMMEIYFFQNIRDDESMDNLDYVRSLLHTIDEMNRVWRSNELAFEKENKVK